MGASHQVYIRVSAHRQIYVNELMKLMGFRKENTAVIKSNPVQEQHKFIRLVIFSLLSFFADEFHSLFFTVRLPLVSHIVPRLVVLSDLL